jgi:hypothetical protein
MLEETCWAGWIWCGRGEESGEPLERDDRSDAEEWIECSCHAPSQHFLIAIQDLADPKE